METLVLLVLAGIVIYALAFSEGKATGSRKGYGVGFDRASRGSRSGGSQDGCLVALLILAWLAVSCAVIA